MHLNEVKYAALLDQLGAATGTLQELEHLWLDSRGMAAGKLGSRWYELFETTGGEGAWTQAAHIYLDSQGIERGHLNERFYLYWQLLDSGNVDIIAMDWVPALDGIEAVYNVATLGSLTPSSWDGSSITRLGSAGPDTCDMVMTQHLKAPQVRVTFQFTGEKIKQGDLTYAVDRYTGTIADMRAISVADIGNTVPCVARKLFGGP